MGARGIVVQPGQGAVSSFSPAGRSSSNCEGGETCDSIMMFEETIPAGTKSTFHLHHDSDEVAYVTRRAACLEEHRRGNRARAVSLYSSQGRWVERRAAADRPQIRVNE
jgi:hypothetical protein